MKKLYILLMFIALVACVACQRQQAQEHQEMTQRDSSASPTTSPEKRYDLKSQAQKFQPRRTVPMTSPSKEPLTSSETPGENKTEKQENDRKEAVQGGEGPSRLPTPAEETSPLPAKIPQAILEPILNKAAELAKVAREQLVMVRAESAVWSDGSLGCPEPGTMYTRALVNGYWVIIDAAGQNYDFRVDGGGNFRLCPPGQGHPPSQAATQ
jgi:hypothetical protein